jgi:hypothetical protein
MSILCGIRWHISYSFWRRRISAFYKQDPSFKDEGWFCILSTSLVRLSTWNRKGTATSYHRGYKIRVPLNPNSFGSSKIILTAIFSWQWVISLWSSGLWHCLICMLCLTFHASIFRVEVSGVRSGKITLAGEHMMVTQKYRKPGESVWTDRNNEYETMRQ